MTDEMMTLPTLLEKSADADLLREMIGFAAQRLMELEVEGLTGAAYGEKNPERLVQRNGYRERDWQTRAGTVELRAPARASGPASRSGARPERRTIRRDLEPDLDAWDRAGAGQNAGLPRRVQRKHVGFTVRIRCKYRGRVWPEPVRGYPAIKLSLLSWRMSWRGVSRPAFVKARISVPSTPQTHSVPSSGSPRAGAFSRLTNENGRSEERPFAK